MTVSRRRFLNTSACGFGSLAFAGLCDSANAEQTAKGLLTAREPHHPPRAKRVIFIFMMGGPSQVDTFDYKPKLSEVDGKEVALRNPRQRVVRNERMMQSPWKFQQHGECGQWVSELFPHQAGIVDDLCFLHGMHTEGVAHGPATLFLHTGATNLIRPSMGSWVTYGLGTENQNLPGFITIHPAPTKGGPRNYSNAFLPTSYQGTVLGRPGAPVANARFRHLANPVMSPSEQRGQLDFLQSLNEIQKAESRRPDPLEATIESFELAFRMQMNAPEVMDLGGETESTLKMYGIGNKPTDDFGRQCLLARKFAESGVRFIQINYSDTSNNPRWDQHSNLKRHETHALATDQPVAALVKDLKARGLLEDTLIWWGGEFGRTPFAQGKDGRDHNPLGFTVWLSGGGVKPGFRYGSTDEYGATAVENRTHMHDLHATILHLLGLDHKQLTHRHAGRDFRLTDVHGRIADGIFA